MRLNAVKQLVAGVCLTLVFWGPVWGQAVDQAQLSGEDFSLSGLTGEFGQTFTPGVDGKLVAVRLFVGKKNDGSSDFTVRIRQMNTLGAITDVILATATVSKDDVTNESNWMEISLNPADPLWQQTAGESLALTIEETGGGGQNNYGYEWDDPSPYAGGTIFASFMPGNPIVPDDYNDLAFQTLVVADEFVYHFQQGVDNGQGVYFEANDVTITRPGSLIRPNQYLRIETNYPTGLETHNSLIRFNGIEDTIKDLRVVNAYLTLTYHDDGIAQPWVNAIIDTYSMLKHYSHINADWTNYDTGLPWAQAGAQGLTDRGDTYTSTDMGPRNFSTIYHSGDKYEFVLPADLVQSWINDPDSNQGILMAMDDIQQVSAEFYSCNYTVDLSYRPLLTIIAVEGCDKIPADINDDCYVNEYDLYLMSAQWLECTGGSADIVDGGDGCVNLLDYALLSAQWLKCSAPGDASCTWPN